MFPCQPRFISTAAVPVQGFVDYQQFSAQLRKLLAEKAHIVHHRFPVRTGATIRWILEKPGSFSGSLNFYHIEHLYLDSFFVHTLSLYIKNGFIWYLPVQQWFYYVLVRAFISSSITPEYRSDKRSLQ